MKRFFAADIRQAMRKVRDEFGPDAVILSNRRVDGGVEIVSAIDYDESLVSNAEHAHNDHLQSTPFLSATTSSSMAAEIANNPPLKSLYDAPPYTVPMEKSGWDDESNIDFESSSSATHINVDFHERDSQRYRENLEDLLSSKKQQDSADLKDMWLEIKALRGLLENQLSTLAWGELTRKHPQQAELFQRLMKLGLSSTLCRQVVAKIPTGIAQTPDIEALWRRALGILAHEVPVLDDDILTHGGIVALIGPTGVGKTTTVAKLAARYALRHGSRHVALVTIDNYRIGAHEQLRSYGRILNIPVRVAADRQELQAVLMELGEKRLILIDTAGMGQRDLRLTAQLKMLTHGEANSESHSEPHRVRRKIKTYLVLSTATRLSGLNEATEAFKGATPDGVILTKIDETTSLGSALSVIIKHQLPIAYVSDGQRVPEDLHNARAHTLISKSIAIMQQSAKMLEDEALTLTVEKVAAHAHI